ncbi:K+ channel tetramerization domain-protein [Kockiozyma suomiensis]|uniref:K+ channel tetramerization domain-protein n=1 Tax=Kockiozyma suomiensis TaxID=1337062 RepID=UPI003342F7E8
MSSLSSASSSEIAGNPSRNTPSVIAFDDEFTTTVFSIQVGDTLFRLSGASLSSDGPSYFTSFFTSQNQKKQREYPTLYIDRNPEVFRDIVRHLQGYYVVPKDEYQFVYLYADAHYYQLPKLVKLLFNSEIFVRIGSTQFRIPKELLSKPGDSPNFFSLGFSSFFASPEEVFPGTRGLIRPPAVAPPQVDSHSELLFQQLLHALKGAPLKFESPEHRDLLIKECRYYHFRGLEQRLIPINISRNLLTGREEITVRLQDVRPAAISADELAEGERRRILYKRPFIEEEVRELVIQVDKNELVLRAYGISEIEGDVNGSQKCKWGVEVIGGSATAEKLMAIIDKVQPTNVRPDPKGPLRLASDLRDIFITIDAVEVDLIHKEDGSVRCLYADALNSSRKRKRGDDTEATAKSNVHIRNLAVVKAQFKLYIVKGMVVMHLLTAECVSSLKEVNRLRKML